MQNIREHEKQHRLELHRGVHFVITSLPQNHINFFPIHYSFGSVKLIQYVNTTYNPTATKIHFLLPVYHRTAHFIPNACITLLIQYKVDLVRKYKLQPYGYKACADAIRSAICAVNWVALQDEP
jgi:hypothetical protein